MKMNKHYNELKASYLFVDIAHKVAAYQEAHPEKEIIRLGIGDVTQPLAKCVVQAMRDAAEEMGTKEGFHGYGPEQGYPFLKQAIQGYYASRGTQLAEDEIFISDGAKSDLANLLGLFDVDNTVLVPDPVYPTYVDDNVTDGRKIIYSRTGQENGFLGMPDEEREGRYHLYLQPQQPHRRCLHPRTAEGMGGLRPQERCHHPVRCRLRVLYLGRRAGPQHLRDRGCTRSVPWRSAPSPRSQALPAPAAATPSCPRSWSARA